MPVPAASEERRRKLLLLNIIRSKSISANARQSYHLDFDHGNKYQLSGKKQAPLFTSTHLLALSVELTMGGIANTICTMTVVLVYVPIQTNEIALPEKTIAEASLTLQLCRHSWDRLLH